MNPKPQGMLIRERITLNVANEPKMLEKINTTLVEMNSHRSKYELLLDQLTCNSIKSCISCMRKEYYQRLNYLLFCT